jgi:hypothetical protein
MMADEFFNDILFDPVSTDDGEFTEPEPPRKAPTPTERKAEPKPAADPARTDKKRSDKVCFLFYL